MGIDDALGQVVGSSDSIGGHPFSQFQCGERLAGAARHDQLAPVVADGEPFEDRVDRVYLMGPGLSLLGGG